MISPNPPLRLPVNWRSHFRARQPTARVPINCNGAQELHVFHIDFVVIHTEGVSTLVYKITHVVDTLNDWKPLSRRTVSKRLLVFDFNG